MQLSSFTHYAQYELLALQDFKSIAALTQLPLVDFMEYVLSENMTKNIIQC